MPLLLVGRLPARTHPSLSPASRTGMGLRYTSRLPVRTADAEAWLHLRAIRSGNRTHAFSPARCVLHPPPAQYVVVVTLPKRVWPNRDD